MPSLRTAVPSLRTAALLVLLPAATAAQPADTLVTWQTYGQEGVARVQAFESNDDDRPWTAVVDELAENGAGLVTDDVRFFVETYGRGVGLDPAGVAFVFRFNGASFCEGGPEGKTLLLRATFTRTKTGRLSAPNWRVLSRDELAELTDRALY